MYMTQLLLALRVAVHNLANGASTVVFSMLELHGMTGRGQT